MFRKDGEGFSLIETLVVIAITGILTAMAIGYTRGNEGRIALIAEQAKLQGMLQRAKALALQGYERGEEDFLGICYGVYLDFPASGVHSFRLFRTPVVPSGGGEVCPRYDSPEKEDIETQPLDPRIAGESGVIHVSFQSPNLEVFANGETFAGSKEIYLRVRDDVSKEAVIVIGDGGSVTAR